jgi:hypothetical protein
VATHDTVCYPVVEVARSSVVVKAMCYKPKGRGFDTRCDSIIYLIPWPHYALEFTQPVTQMSTRNIKIIMFLGSKVRLVRRDDNLTAIYELIF